MRLANGIWTALAALAAAGAGCGVKFTNAATGGGGATSSSGSAMGGAAATGTGTGASAGAGGDGGANVDTLCGGPGVLSDDFSATVLSDEWSVYTEQGATVDTTSGVLRLTMLSGVAQSYIHIGARHIVRFRDEAMTVEAPVIPDASGAWVAMAVEGGTDEYFETRAFGDHLELALRDNAAEDMTTVSYDATAHRFLQLREEEGTIYWEGSADGGAWTVLRSEPTPAWADYVTPRFYAYVFNAPGTVQIAELDNLNPQSATWCPMHSLVDDFADDALATAWELTDFGDCIASESGGAIELALGGGASGSCTLRSRAAFDLRDSNLTLHFRDISANNGVYLALTLDGLGGDDIEMGLLGSGDIRAAARQNAQLETDDTMSYDASTSPWWRIEESGGTISWQVSADGATWSTLKSWPATIARDALDVEVRLSTSTSLAAPVTIRLEDANP